MRANVSASRPVPDARAAIGALTAELKTHGIVVYGPHADGSPATFELRAMLLSTENIEDPVTGSANAALAALLTQQRNRPGDAYTVRQGTALDRDGRVKIVYDDASDKPAIWIGGHSVTMIDGTFLL